MCPFCPEVHSTEHTFFGCAAFDELQGPLYGRLGVLTPDNVIEPMLESAENWSVNSAFIRAVITLKDLVINPPSIATGHTCVLL